MAIPPTDMAGQRHPRQLDDAQLPGQRVHQHVKGAGRDPQPGQAVLVPQGARALQEGLAQAGGRGLAEPPPLRDHRPQQAVDQVARKLSEKFDVESEWMDDVLAFRRSGVDGRIALDEHTIHVTAKLGFLLAAMKGPIEAEIRRMLAEKLGPAD